MSSSFLMVVVQKLLPFADRPSGRASRVGRLQGPQLARELFPGPRPSSNLAVRWLGSLPPRVDAVGDEARRRLEVLGTGKSAAHRGGLSLVGLTS